MSKPSNLDFIHVEKSLGNHHVFFKLIGKNEYLFDKSFNTAEMAQDYAGLQAKLHDQAHFIMVST